MLKDAKDFLRLELVELENIKVVNSQLNHPVKKTEKRNLVLVNYKKGYKFVDRQYKKEQRIVKIKNKLAKIKFVNWLYHKIKKKKH